MRCLRCLRDLEKWSWIEKIGKNRAKMGKNGQKWLSENPQLYTTTVLYAKHVKPITTQRRILTH